MAKVDNDIEQIFGTSAPSFVEIPVQPKPTLQQDISSVMGNQDIQHIITGLPNQGSIYMTPEGKFGSQEQGYYSFGTDKLSDIVQKTYGTTDPYQIQQMFNLRGALPYGQYQAEQVQQRDPESVAPIREQAPDLGGQAESEFAREILQQEDEFGNRRIPESELLAQQFLKGGLGVGSYMDEIYNALEQDPKKKFQYEQMIKYYEKEFPERAIPTQIAGTVASVVLGGRFLQGIGGMKGATNTINKFKEWYNSLPKLGKITTEAGAVTTGAGIEGLIYGYGEGSGDERGENALKRGMTNVIFTTPFATAFPIVRTIMDKPSLASQQTEAIAKEFGISLSAAEIIRDTYNSGGTLKQMMEQIMQSGDQRMIAEANEGFKQILDAASNMSGKSAQIVQDEMQKRIGTQTQEFGDVTSKYFGTPTERQKTILDDIEKEFGDDTRNAYDKAWGSSLDFNSEKGIELLDVLSRINPNLFKKAIDDANQLVLADRSIGREFQPIRFNVNPNTGRIELIDQPSLFQLDMLKRSLDDVVESNRDPISNKVLGADGQSAQLIVNDLRSILKDMSPDYKKALTLGQGQIKTRNMVDFGNRFFRDNTSVDEVIEKLRGASASEISALRKTVRGQIDKIINDVKVAATTSTEQEVRGQQTILNRLLSGTNKNKLVELLGEKDANKYIKVLTENKKTFELQARTRLGSQTAPRKATDERITEMADRGFLGQLFEVNPVGAMKQLREFIAGNPSKELITRKDEIYSELAGFLVGRKGQGADTALQYLEAVRRGDKLGKAQQSYLVNMFKGFLSPSSEIFFGTMGNQLENVSP